MTIKRFNVYVLENKYNNKLYVGQTIQNVKDRWSNHKKDSKRLDYVLYRAIRKYGIESFHIKSQMAVNSKEEMNELETFLISELNTFTPNGYNMTAGGEGQSGVICSEEKKQKISNSLKGKMSGENNPRYGVKVSEETKQKISKKGKGKFVSEETRRKQSLSRMGVNNHFFGVKGVDHPLYGKPRAEETKKKISESHKGKIFTEEHRANISRARSKTVINTVNNNRYDSVKILAKELNIPYSTAKCYLNEYCKVPDWFNFKYEIKVEQ
jgi:group I intron endonuclease